MRNFFFSNSIYLLLFLFLGIQSHAQKVSDVRYSLTPYGDVHIYYTVAGESTDSTVQLRIAYSYPDRYGNKKWLTLKRDYFDVIDGEVYARGDIELVNIKNFVETAEVQFEIVSNGRVVQQLYFENLLERAVEIEPQVFAPVAIDKNTVRPKPDKRLTPSTNKTNEPYKPDENTTYVKVDRIAATAKIIRTGTPIRGLINRRIIQRCYNFENLGFPQEGVAWFYVGVSESGRVFTAIYTVKTTSGEESSITDEEQIKIARLCVKKFRFNSVSRSVGKQYGFVPVYFSN
ncbi:MAG: hypothetical protein MK212_17760 [Saprospiraceae bacterium]|nr:hypothetical protein [Saprospiraceae bacterium]